MWRLHVWLCNMKSFEFLQRQARMGMCRHFPLGCDAVHLPRRMRLAPVLINFSGIGSMSLWVIEAHSDCMTGAFLLNRKLIHLQAAAYCLCNRKESEPSSNRQEGTKGHRYRRGSYGRFSSTGESLRSAMRFQSSTHLIQTSRKFLRRYGPQPNFVLSAAAVAAYSLRQDPVLGKAPYFGTAGNLF